MFYEKEKKEKKEHLVETSIISEGGGRPASLHTLSGLSVYNPIIFIASHLIIFINI